MAQAEIHSQGRSILKLRLIAVICALAFIPAFMYGWTVVWAPVCAVAVALLFRKGLKNIIAGYAGMEDPKAIARHVYRKLPLLVLQCAAITALPQLAAGWLYGAGVLVWAGLSPHAPDQATGFYKWFFPSAFEKFPAAVLDPQKMIAADVYGFSVVLFFALLVIAMKPLWEVLNRLMHKELIIPPRTHQEKAIFFRRSMDYYSANGFYLCVAVILYGIVYFFFSDFLNQGFSGAITELRMLPSKNVSYGIVLANAATYGLLLPAFLGIIAGSRFSGRNYKHKTTSIIGKHR